MNEQVIYDKYTEAEGPMNGWLNRDRKYQADFTSCKSNMGSYHYLDRQRVRVSYRGNPRTCGRCQVEPEGCKGGGIASICESNCGERVDIMTLMRRLWKHVNFTPSSFKLPDKDQEETEEANNYDGDCEVTKSNFFEPIAVISLMETPERKKYTHLQMSNLMKTGDILEILKNKVDARFTEDDIKVV